MGRGGGDGVADRIQVCWGFKGGGGGRGRTVLACRACVRAWAILSLQPPFPSRLGVARRPKPRTRLSAVHQPLRLPYIFRLPPQAPAGRPGVTRYPLAPASCRTPAVPAAPYLTHAVHALATLVALCPQLLDGLVSPRRPQTLTCCLPYTCRTCCPAGTSLPYTLPLPPPTAAGRPGVPRRADPRGGRQPAPARPGRPRAAPAGPTGRRSRQQGGGRAGPQGVRHAEGGADRAGRGGGRSRSSSSCGRVTGTGDRCETGIPVRYAC